MALPVWQFFLPLYAFWHFDDFTWGQTRLLQGAPVETGGHGEEELGDGSHSKENKTGCDFGVNDIPMKRFIEYEMERKAIAK
jgi:chitin synthase